MKTLLTTAGIVLLIMVIRFWYTHQIYGHIAALFSILSIADIDYLHRYKH